MRFARASKSFAAWIAGVGVLMAALAPAISSALHGAAAAEWTTVCSVLGAKIVPLDRSTDRSVPSPDPGHPFEHCPYCSLHTVATGFLPATSAAALLLVLSFAPPGLPDATRRLPPRAWGAPQSRAPPASS